MTPDLRSRYGEIGIVPVIFGTFPTCEDLPWTQFWMDNGEDWRALVDANPGLPIAWHGDDPWVAPISPLHDLASYADVQGAVMGQEVAFWLAKHAVGPVE